MPPMLSDDESDGMDIPEQIPAKAKKQAKVAEPEEEEEAEAEAADVQEDNEEEEEEGGEAEEYTVEKILAHNWLDDGTVVYEIKWLGYEKKSDRTWEPIENLDSAKELLAEYHTSIGGPPGEKPSKSSAKKSGKKGKRPASEAFDDSPAPTSNKKRVRKSDITNGDAGAKDKFVPPDGSWEEHVTRVISIVEDSVVEKQGRRVDEIKTLMGLLEWKTGNKTQHNMLALRRKCPQKLLDYYEQHLVFTQTKQDEVDD